MEAETLPLSSPKKPPDPPPFDLLLSSYAAYTSFLCCFSSSLCCRSSFPPPYHHIASNPPRLSFSPPSIRIAVEIMPSIPLSSPALMAADLSPPSLMLSSSPTLKAHFSDLSLSLIMSRLWFKAPTLGRVVVVVESLIALNPTTRVLTVHKSCDVVYGVPLVDCLRIYTAVCRALLCCLTLLAKRYQSSTLVVDPSLPTSTRLFVVLAAALDSPVPYILVMKMSALFSLTLEMDCSILSRPGLVSACYRLCSNSMEPGILNGPYHMNYLLYTAATSLTVVVAGASVSAAQPISPPSSLTRKSVLLSLLTVKPLVSSRGQKIPHEFELLEMVSVRYPFQTWWCLLVACSPAPPEPPDPPDFIISSLCSFVIWIFDSTVLTLSNLGDMSIVTARSATAPIPSSNQGSLLLVIWNVWRLDSSPLPLYEDRFTLPLYEDRFILPLYEDRSTLPLYEEFVTLPLYEDPDSFMEFVTLLYSLFLNSCVTTGFIKGSFDRCLYASVAILEIGNCASVAVPISGFRSSAQGVILLNNSIVQEIRGLLEDFYLFKCYVAIILLSLSSSVVVIVSFYAMMAMFVGNTYSVFGD